MVPSFDFLGNKTLTSTHRVVVRVLVLGVLIQRRMVTRLLVPEASEVVGHDVHEVQGAAQSPNVVGHVNDLVIDIYHS